MDNVKKSHTEDNKRLAKNTVALYVRNAVTMPVALYVSRVLLKMLGVDDFGIYNVVGSIVILFSFMSTAMSSASQRFITYELGTGDMQSTNRVFCASFMAQIFIAVILIAIVEIFGYWFLNYKLNIPDGRLMAANFAFQFSILAFAIRIVQVPYEATVVANEKMNFFAYASVADSLLKLGLVFLLKLSGYDKLITYAALIAAESFLMWFVYRLYCKRHFSTCDFHIVRDKSLFKRLFSFTGWSLWGSGANVLTQQGFTFILNIFYGVAVNAAMGIANQINSAMNSFVGSFQTSYRPQIVKTYAKNDFEHLNDLIFSTSKMSYCLMVLPTLLLIFNMPLVLDIWLINPPPYAAQFCQMILICIIIDATTGSYNAAIMATGKIRNYQLAISASFFLDLVASFLLIKAGVLPYLVLISRIVTRGLFNMFIGLFFLKSMLFFKIKNYLRHVIVPIVAQLCIMVPVLSFFYERYDSWTMLALSSLIVIMLGIFTIVFIVFNTQERSYAFGIFKNKWLAFRGMKR
jgi:O-antigen/teichoic acid export membrane protein